MNVGLTHFKIFNPLCSVPDEYMQLVFNGTSNSVYAESVLILDLTYRLLVFRDDVLCTVASYHIFPDHIYLNRIASIEEKRGGASFVINYLKEIMYNMNLKSILLKSAIETRDFYERHGFKHIKDVTMEYRK